MISDNARVDMFAPYSSPTLIMKADHQRSLRRASAASSCACSAWAWANGTKRSRKSGPVGLAPAVSSQSVAAGGSAGGGWPSWTNY
ncbi:hypothetical protein, partial [Xanthomonas fragariae]|uniref:hypothetical protein n=1 Tax=Xanthomonas fragariae TaxID=48664 RepID=UPI001F30DE7F